MKKQIKMLTVRAVGDVLVPDLDAAVRNVRRFIGRQTEHPWDALPDPVQVPARAEYVRCVDDGELELVSD